MMTEIAVVFRLVKGAGLFLGPSDNAQVPNTKGHTSSNVYVSFPNHDP